MSWTKEMVTEFQMGNNLGLIEVNSTLRPDKKATNGKIGIFLPGQNGDLITAMSVLRYRNELWSDKEIIWYCNMPNADALKYSPVNEVRPWPWAGNGLPEGTPDFYPLLCNENNRLNKDLAGQYDLTKDLDDGYFPAPHQLTVEKRNGIEYPNCSRTVFGIDPKAEWHPLLSFSELEVQEAHRFVGSLPYQKTIMLETTCGSGQSMWDDEMTTNTMKICRQFLGDYNFIFMSHSDNSRFFDAPGVVSASQFTVRQAAILNNYSHLFIGISSGISVATSAWGMKPVPKIQFCGSRICSTVALANGKIELITSDGVPPDMSKYEYYLVLRQTLSQL